MKKNIKKYQYWWNTGEGYALEEFENMKELIDLMSHYPTSDFFVTEKIKDVLSINSEEEGKEGK